jgi:hypothetical protein
VLLTALAQSGCDWDAPPVDWQSPVPVASVQDSAAQFVARWAPGRAGEVAVARRDSALLSAEAADRPASACPGSWVSSATVRGQRWVAWWQVRRDSSAVVIAALRDSADQEVRRVVVDSLDRALVGCARPAPAIAVDSVNGYVHISYHMVAPEGPGVFYAHLMDPRASHFEVPMAVVYGERPVRVAVASRADTVALAYEDPNSERGRIALSLSLTAGHVFDQTARLIPVSTSSQQAMAPEIVRLAGGALWVGWTEQSQSGSAYLVRRARIVTR